MKRPKIGHLATKDLQEIADTLPEVWVPHRVTHQAKGQFILNSGLPQPVGLRKNLNKFYHVTYSGWTFVNHFKKLKRIAQECPEVEDKIKYINDYVDQVLDLNR